MAGDVAGEIGDAGGTRVVLPADVWSGKILRDHPELSSHLADVLRAVAEPDLVLPDPVFETRRRYYLRDAGPSRWLLVVVAMSKSQRGSSRRLATGRIQDHGAREHQDRAGHFRPC